MGWHSNMSSLGPLTSCCLRELSAGASPLEEKFLFVRALWDASVLNLPNYCLVDCSLHPKGHKLETSQVLRGEREENVFPLRLSRQKYELTAARFPWDLNPAPSGGRFSHSSLKCTDGHGDGKAGSSGVLHFALSQVSSSKNRPSWEQCYSLTGREGRR